MHENQSTEEQSSGNAGHFYEHQFGIDVVFDFDRFIFCGFIDRRTTHASRLHTHTHTHTICECSVIWMRNIMNKQMDMAISNKSRAFSTGQSDKSNLLPCLNDCTVF